MIETIVVVAVIALTLPVIFAIIFTLMREQLKVYRLTEVKRNGDYLINSVENTLREQALTIMSDLPANGGVEICKNVNTNSSGSKMVFLDKDGNWFEYSHSGNMVSSSSANINSEPLVSNKTLVSAFTISCKNNSTFSAPEVSMSFDICYDTTGTGSCASIRPEELATIHYQSIVKLRSY